MAKKKSKRRRSPKQFSLWDGTVAYGNLSILTEGALGTSPYGFITGKPDLASTTKSLGIGLAATDVMTVTGGEEISLGDMMSEPGLAWQQINSNMSQNAMSIAFQAISFNVGAKLTRRLLRAPINSANRLIRPMGLGVQI